MGGIHKGYFNLVIYSILVGTLGIFVRLVQGLDSLSIVFVRAVIATIFILLVAIGIGKLKELKLVNPKQTLLVGFLQGLSIFMIINAYLYTNISNAIFLVYTAPIFSAILANIFLKEKIEKETIIGIIVTLIGIIFILDPTTFSFESSQTFGNLMGLGSGFFYAAMAIAAKPVLKKASGFNVAFWQYLIISFMFMIFMRSETTSTLIENWWQLGAIGVICTGIPFILFMKGIKKVKGQKIFIITSLEPLVGTILAILLLSEMLSMFTIIGAILIMYGVYRTTKK